MSSDTESTVCDPRLEVASEPQVPKGPGQIRRVPQLFTATARSTPVVPPQVQQDSGGNWGNWSRPSDSRLRLTGTIVALAGARAELKFRSKNSNAFSRGDQKMSTSEAPPEAGRCTPATQLQLSN